MSEEQNVVMIKQAFDAASEGYDHKALRFFSKSAEHLSASLDLRGDEHVLDVATGTGNAALAIAARLPAGRVTGVDISRGMLEQARNKASLIDHRNVEFIEQDMRGLAFPPNHFDAAVCSFGIFFVEDMQDQLLRIADVVRLGGRVAITTLQEDYFSPLKEMMHDRLTDYGVEKSPQTWRTVAIEAGCRRLFEQAGLSDIRIELKDVGYCLDSSEDWWNVIMNAGFRRLISQLDPEDIERFKVEHLLEVDALKNESGIRLDVPVLFTIGTKPS